MKIFLNGLSLLSPHTGIGRYTKSLAFELKREKSIELTLFYGFGVDQKIRESHHRQISSLKEFVKKYTPESAARAFERWILSRSFKRYESQIKPDIYHEPNYLLFPSRTPSVITVHDISFIRHPETHPRARIVVMNRYFKESLLRAAALITDSNFTARELISVFPEVSDKVHTVYLGVNQQYSPVSLSQKSMTCEKYGIESGKYILTVGTLEPRKNLNLLFQAYQELPEDYKNRYKLFVVGMKGWKTESISLEMKTLIQNGSLILPGFIDENDMPAIYSAASCFVYPSLYEGFGLPSLEAMACGTPVIVSNASSLPEVTGRAAVLVAPDNKTQLASALFNFLNDRNMAEKYSAMGIKQAKNFTWKKCAEETVKIYESVQRK